MPLRLIEAVVPQDAAPDLGPLVDDGTVLGVWKTVDADDRLIMRVLTTLEQTETLIDRFENECSGSPDFRLVLLAVEATIPRPDEQETPDGKDAQEKEASSESHERASREELYADIEEGARFSVVYFATVALSTIVAAIGLLRNDTAVIIGAMVIAPLLGPNVALALATTLGDTKLALNSLKVNVAGLMLALGLSILIGLLFAGSAKTPAIEARTSVALGDILLALAAGAAGALAVSRGAPTALIGVMVAVALLPPLVVVGLELSAGRFHAAFEATLLASTNIICVNLAGVGTFLLQGIRPRNWYEADRAKHAARVAIAFWGVMLGLLILTVYLSQ